MLHLQNRYRFGCGWHKLNYLGFTGTGKSSIGGVGDWRKERKSDEPAYWGDLGRWGIRLLLGGDLLEVWPPGGVENGRIS
jgi:hypothetical protein